MMLPNRGKNRAWRLVRRAERRRMVPDPAGMKMARLCRKDSKRGMDGTLR